MRPKTGGGVTLLELMIAVSLVSVVALGFGMIYGAAQTSLTDATQASSGEAAVSLTVSHVGRRLREASRAKFDRGPETSSDFLKVWRRTDRQDPDAVTVGRYCRKAVPRPAGNGTEWQLWWFESDTCQPVSGDQGTLVARDISVFDVTSSADRNHDGRPDALTKADPVATITVGSRGVMRTSSVQLRGWHPPVESSN